MSSDKMLTVVNGSSPDMNFPEVADSEDEVLSKMDEKKMMMDNMTSALEEFMVMVKAYSSLWMWSKEYNSHVLNEIEYSKFLGKRTGPRAIDFRHEASVETTWVAMSPMKLVGVLMDEKEWSSVFSAIVAKATKLEVLPTADPHIGDLHLINAEFQVLSPTVQTREIRFWRYCMSNSADSWTVVDFSPDDNWQKNELSVRCRRKPSGCLIEAVPEGSNVTWVEHVEVDAQEASSLYTPLIHSGYAFGAKRWISILKWHCEHLARIVKPIVADFPSATMEGKRGMLNLARKMVENFHKGMSSSTAQPWDLLPGTEREIPIRVRKSMDGPAPKPGTIITCAASFQLPFRHHTVFTFLRKCYYRHEWDTFSDGHVVEEIVNFSDEWNKPWNNTSLLSVSSRGENPYKFYILQENHSDHGIGSFITYAPLVIEPIKLVLAGWDPDDVVLFPSGIAIYPDKPTRDSGSLVTISFQVFVSSTETLNESIGTLENRIISTIGKIKSKFGPSLNTVDLYCEMSE